MKNPPTALVGFRSHCYIVINLTDYYGHLS
jgi:hypothetical protein